MCKKDKNKLLIFFFYFLSFLLFDLVFLIYKFDGNIKEIIGGNYDFFDLLSSFANAGVYHFVFISFIAICVKFMENIDIEYKHIFYWFPLCTFIFALPMSIPTIIVIKLIIFIAFLI